jgi:hypothetical protein
MESNPLDPVASEPPSHAGQVFTSDLSINEFALLLGAGFEPIELVMGVSVYHVGYQFTGIRQQSEWPCSPMRPTAARGRVALQAVNQ